MVLKSDSQGFLVGDVVASIRRAVDPLKQIRADILNFKRSMMGALQERENGGANNSGSNASVNSVPNATTSVATPTGAVGNQSAEIKILPPVRQNDVATPTGTVGNQSAEIRALSPASTKNDVATPTGTKGGDQNPAIKALSPVISNNVATPSTKSRDAADMIAAVKAPLSRAEETDPTIKAAKEVAEPLARGYEIFSGGGNKKETWYRKIFRELSLFRKDESAFNKAEAKVLKDIAEKPAGVGSSANGGGIMSSIGTMLAGLFGGRTVGAGGGVLGMAGKGLLGAGKGLLGAGKGLFKRIPLLGALIGGVSAASDIYGTENDDSLTRAEKDRRDGKAFGGFAGSFGGMAAGAAAGSLLGPIGTVVGGAAMPLS